MEWNNEVHVSSGPHHPLNDLFGSLSGLRPEGGQKGRQASLLSVQLPQESQALEICMLDFMFPSCQRRAPEHFPVASPTLTWAARASPAKFSCCVETKFSLRWQLGCGKNAWRLTLHLGLGAGCLIALASCSNFRLLPARDWEPLLRTH